MDCRWEVRNVLPLLVSVLRPQGYTMLAGHAVLREATADKHGQVDAAFEQFDLGDARSY